MTEKKGPTKQLALVGIIIIATFVYGIEIHAVATGNIAPYTSTILELTSNPQTYERMLTFFSGTYTALSPWSLLTQQLKTYSLKSFSSYEEFTEFLKANTPSYGGFYCYEGRGMVTMSMDTATAVPNGISGSSHKSNVIDYSETNIQVQGVDEPDTVKTDGTYLYLVANEKVYIIQAYPPEDARVLSEITLDDNINLNDIFINDDRLILFGASYRYPVEYEEDMNSWWNGVSSTIIHVYDISDRENPDLVEDIEIDGSYSDARMIDDFVYVITTEYTNQIYRVVEDNTTRTMYPEITTNGETETIPLTNIYYMDIPEKIDTMTHVIALNIHTEEMNQKSFLIGSSQTLYVSQQHIYLTYPKYNYYIPIVDDIAGTNQESTIIHKISIDRGEITYTVDGEVPGRILNQFSMDEHDGFFRIATTIGHVWDSEQSSSNNIYILDDNLEQVSAIEDIAPGERIYSARFMGEKAYLVTFKKIDPFFTIDLSDPYNPQILGKLKIPGYSDYLHPYDDDHIIGIGKDTVEALDEQKEYRNLDFAWYQGLKIALFDVSDFENPQEVAKVVIGDRGTHSPVLSDHKALLFDREKELLVLPVDLYVISDDIKEQYDHYTGSTYGEFSFQGAYVYRLSLDDGFDYQGRITHFDEDDDMKSGYYGYWGSSSITRSLYIGDVLYTLSNAMVKMNDLSTLNEINSLVLH